MKIKVTINNEEVEINLTAEQVKEVLASSNSVFDIDYKHSCYFLDIFKNEVLFGQGSNEYLNVTGMYRQSEKLAKISAKNMIQRNKLEELVMWLEPNVNLDFTTKVHKYYIAYNHSSGNYYTNYSSTSKIVGAVYMSKETAELLINALEKGQLPEIAKLLKEQ